MTEFMDGYKLLILLLTLGVFLSCSTPEENEPTAEQMVLTGLHYEDHQPITITIEGGLITNISREVTGEKPIYYLSPWLDRSSGKRIFVSLFCRWGFKQSRFIGGNRRVLEQGNYQLLTNANHPNFGRAIKKFSNPGSAFRRSTLGAIHTRTSLRRSVHIR